MAELIVQPAAEEVKSKHGWFYVAKLLAAGVGILLCLVTLKFLAEHKLVSKNAGLEGALAQPELNLLLIGSSHTRKSYDVRQLERVTGDPSLFLISYDGIDLNSIAQMLEIMADSPGKCPKHVVIEAYSALLGRRPDLEDPRYFAEAPPSLKMAILRSYIAGRRFPSAFLDVFDLIVNRGNDEIVAFPFYDWAQNLDSYKGGRDAFTFPGLTPEQFRRLKAGVYGAVPDPDQVAALDRIVDLATSHHIALLFVDTPMPGTTSSNPVIQSLKRDFKQLVTNRGLPYIDGNEGFPIDDPSLFSDSNHLSSKGRDEFTARIAVTIKAWLAGDPGAPVRY
jgi:hypothetical protein